MVLAIGIVVDDAIMVLKNVEHIMHEQGKSARDAATQAIQSNSSNEHVIAFSGMGFIGGDFKNSAAAIFVTQKHWDERPSN